MKVVLVPQGSAVNVMVIPHEEYVEMMVVANALDAHLLLYCTDLLKVALWHHPRRAATLEFIASEHHLRPAEVSAKWDDILMGIPRHTNLAYIISDSVFDYSLVKHVRDSNLRVVPSRRAALSWFEQSDIRPVAEPPRTHSIALPV